MKNIYLLPYFLIGFSYTFLLYNKIFFGVSLLLGIITLFFLTKKSIKLKLKFSDNKINFFFFNSFFFLISSIFSIKPERSILVTIYFIFCNIKFKFISCITKKEDDYKKIINIFIISTIINILIIFGYNIYESGLIVGDLEIYGIKKYKGLLNIFSILVLILFFFKRSKLFLLPLILILPSLYLSNSNAPVLGFLVGSIVFIVYKMIKKFNINKISFFTLALLFYNFSRFIY